jgi:flagellar basal body P-ring formation protein FlgA
MRTPQSRPATLVAAYLLSLLAAVVVSLLLPHAVAAQPTPDASAAGRIVANTTPALRNDQRRVSFTVAARALARGDTLRSEDVAVLDTVITWRWNGSAPDTTRAQAGWITRRPIAVGEVLRAPAVMPPPVITSGATVTAIWQDGPLKLVLSGVATNTATVGAPVGVRIDRSRRLDGIAIAPNTVRLR